MPALDLPIELRMAGVGPMIAALYETTYYVGAKDGVIAGALGTLLVETPLLIPSHLLCLLLGILLCRSRMRNRKS